MGTGTYCSILKCLFSTPVWFFWLRVAVRFSRREQCLVAYLDALNGLRTLLLGQETRSRRRIRKEEPVLRVRDREQKPEVSTHRPRALRPYRAKFTLLPRLLLTRCRSESLPRLARMTFNQKPQRMTHPFLLHEYIPSGIHHFLITVLQDDDQGQG